MKLLREKRKDVLNFRQRMKTYILKMKVISHYSNGKNECECCGEKNFEFLTIDHLPNAPHKRNNENRSGTEFYHWLRRNNYPKGFRVLCMNCNFSIGKFGYCPHKLEGKKREMLTCYICKKPFVKISEHEYKPDCDHLGEIIIGVGGTNAIHV